LSIGSTVASPRTGLVVAPSVGTLWPIPLADVRITGGFWGDRQRVNTATTLRHCLDWMERLGWIANFDQTAAGAAGPRAGREFADSEIYKLLEALAWTAQDSGETWAEETYSSLARRVVAAQQPDGYLSTRFGGPGQAARYSDLEWGHELYCAGHLIQAAVARVRTVGSDELVECAIRLADHICDTFGPGGIERVCGHPEIELALVELSRATGDARYLEQARLFVERRGGGLLADPEVPASYFVDDLPVRAATVLRGHAVRALYLSAGAADVAVETGDGELLDALRTQWRNTVARRTYLTGGMGSRHEGESFGDDFELPSDRAYSETCAGIASVMFSWRMLLADGDPAYADLIERTLYNVVATSPNEAGTAFFYVNPLQRNEAGTEPPLDRASARAASSQRAPWFEVSCCPTNVARTFASVGGYLATVTDTGIQLHQYMPSTIRTTLADGRPIALRVETAYPANGRIRVVVEEDSSDEWTITMRVPNWAIGAATLSDGATRRTVDEPTVSVTRAFRAGDSIVLEIPVAPRLTAADPRVDAIRGSVAVEAGPLVLCAESIDQDGRALRDLRVSRTAAPVAAEGGTAAIAGVIRKGDPLGPEAHGANPWPYGKPANGALPEGAVVSLSPYYQWAERGPSQMRIWLPLDEQLGLSTPPGEVH
jgi:DUF1680 family protein